jgi:hypothetical protein
MATLGGILEENRKAAENTPAAAEIQPTGEVKSEADEFSEEEKKLMRENPSRWTPEKIRAVKGYNGQGAAVEHYKNIFQEPEIDERALNRNRTIGILGDGLKILGQMYGAYKGARIKELDSARSLTSHFASKEEEARERYRKSLDDWKKGYYGAALSDAQAKNSYLAAMQNQMADDTRFQKQWDRQGEWRTQDVEHRDTVHADTKQHQADMLAATEKQNKIQNSLHWANFNANNNRDDSDVIYLKPHADDRSAGIKTMAGIGRVLPVSLTKQEIESVAASAIGDAKFVAAHPELFKKVKKTDVFGNEYYESVNGSLDIKTIVSTYMQEKYNEGMPTPLPAANPKSGREDAVSKYSPQTQTGTTKKIGW